MIDNRRFLEKQIGGNLHVLVTRMLGRCVRLARMTASISEMKGRTRLFPVTTKVSVHIRGPHANEQQCEQAAEQVFGTHSDHR